MSENEAREQAIQFGRWMVLGWCPHHRDPQTGKNLLTLDRQDMEGLLDLWLADFAGFRTDNLLDVATAALGRAEGVAEREG